MTAPRPGRPYEFVIADVFAETPFGGNQLAVLPDARGLSLSQMQAVAREFNFAETTFVLPPDDAAHTARVRIFTPTAEMPFAGHPTVGTAAVLVARGAAGESAVASLVLEENIGPIAVEVRREAGGFVSRFTLGGAVETPPEKPLREDVARCLSLPPEAVVDSWFASVGARFCFVHVASRESVDAAFLDRAAWRATQANAWSPHLFFFAGQPRSGGALYARMFAPTLGVEEDPATGSAAAALVGSVSTAPSMPDGELRLRIEQGVKLGRPSVIHAAAERRDGRLAAIHVSGSTLVVAEGTLRVPDL